MIVTSTSDEMKARTTLAVRVRTGPKAARAAALKTGTTDGVSDTYDRLASMMADKATALELKGERPVEPSRARRDHFFRSSIQAALTIATANTVPAAAMMPANVQAIASPNRDAATV